MGAGVMVGRRGGCVTSGRGVSVDGGWVGVPVGVGDSGVPVGLAIGAPVSTGARGVSDGVGVSVSVGLGDVAVVVGVIGTDQPSVVWHLEHWPRGWLDGRSWE